MTDRGVPHLRLTAGLMPAVALAFLTACGQQAPNIELTVEARVAAERADEAARSAEIEAGVAATMAALTVPTEASALTDATDPIETSTAVVVTIPTAAPQATYTPLPTAVPEATPTPLPTYTPVPTPTATPVPTPTRAATPLPTSTATPVPTPTRTATPLPTPTLTPTPVPTNTPLPTPTPEPTVEDVVDKARRSVVHIIGRAGSGSGFVVDSAGYILTNEHVVEGQTEVTVILDSGMRTFGRVAVQDASRDMALVKIDRGRQPALPLASSVRIGQDVVALGYPFGTSGLENLTISTGVISAIQSFDGISYVQTDAAVNSGNSGGPLLNMDGRVVGMNTSGIPKSISEGLNFAIQYSVLSERLKVLVAEANAPPTPTPVRPVGSFGPADGSIAHMPEDGLIDVYRTGVLLADGVIEARFFNPYSAAAGSWSSGFMIRASTLDPAFHAVVVTEDGWWGHVLRDRHGEDRHVDGGFSAAIGTGPFDSNFIRIIAIGGEGTLFVNGQFVAALDLGGLLDAGGVSALASYYPGDGVAGESTQFEGFRTRSIRPTSLVAFGPEDGVIGHDLEDGLIDVYGADASLADGIIEARFFNPYAAHAGSWSSGFLFRLTRSSPDNTFHAVVVTGAGRWRHDLRVGDGQHQRVGGGFSSAIATGEFDSNQIQVVAIGGDGALFVNGQFVAALDLSGLMGAGSVSAVAAYYTGDGVAGESTRFEDFRITELR